MSVPKPGYLVIYADMSNAYRTVHIGSVTDVQDLGDGLYAVTTVEGNMSNSVKSYSYVYDSNKPNHMVGVEEGLKLQNNMSELPGRCTRTPWCSTSCTRTTGPSSAFARPGINPFHPAQNAV